MRHFDFEKFIFRLNVFVTGIVFFLLIPTIRIYASWYPDKQDTLWLFPAGVLLFSCVFWLMARLSLPYFIRKGWVADLRQSPRPETTLFQKLLKFLPPIAVTIFHFSLLIWFCISFIAFMRSGSSQHLFLNVP